MIVHSGITRPNDAMLIAMADMLSGVFLRYVMTKVSAFFDMSAPSPASCLR